MQNRKEPIDDAYERVKRLKNSQNILGQPDMIFQTSTKVISSFFGKQKKQQVTSSYYVVGLNFPTTAHFSSFITSKLNYNICKNNSLKIKYFMFDCFKSIDIHIQVNIPGSTEIKGYNLQGQPFSASLQDYERAYYSSILRSLYPIFTPKIRFFNQIYRLAVLKNFIIEFVPFSFKNDIRQLNYNFGSRGNSGLQLLLYYLKKCKHHNLIKGVIKELNKISPSRAAQIQLQYLYSNNFYQEVIQKSNKILLEDSSRQFIKQIQLYSLHKQKKYSQCKTLGEIIIHEGAATEEVWHILADSYINLNRDALTLKVINTAITLKTDNEAKIQNLVKILPSQIFEESPKHKSNKLSDYPQLFFPFTNDYLNRQERYLSFKQALKKVNKQKQILLIIQKIDNCLSQTLPLYEILVKYQKEKGWNKLVDLRSSCFWLENDFRNYQNNFKQSNYQTMPMVSEMNSQSQKSPQTSQISNNVHKLYAEDDPLEKKITKNEQQINKSFEGNFSEASDNQSQMPQIQPCSKRVHTKRMSNFGQKYSNSKILCNIVLQNLFLSLFEDLKLQNFLDKWAQKLSLNNLSPSEYNHKKELIAITLLKKGFLNKKLLRKKKSQESFKTARKYSQSVLVNIIACYSLAELYLENRNCKGVQFYVIEVVKILIDAGISKFDVVPQWATEILAFIIQTHGKSIVKQLQRYYSKVDGPLKQLLIQWLVIDNQLIEKKKQ